MARLELLTATLSANGQLNLPKSVLESRQWGAGTELLIEETSDGVVLRLAPAFERSRYEDVFGSLTYDGEPKTIEDMNQALLDEAQRGFARG